MINLRDHYFIAWLAVEKKIEYHIMDDGNIKVDITAKEYAEYLKEYSKVKPLFKKVRQIVKSLNSI